MLVGPNNAGKSTIIGAFRALSVAVRTGRARNATQHLLNDGIFWGHRISSEAIPISLENAQHNYNEDEAVAMFHLSNGGTLKLVFSPEFGCLLTSEYDNRPVKTAASFRQRFPLTIGVVPVLGPLEHDEQQVEESTVQRNLQTHRASRNFRNYWYYNDEVFEELQQAVRDSWDGIEVQKPEIDYQGMGPTRLHMWCTENRITRELYWMGFGFHVWLQIMTHVMRNRGASLLIMDEPETYMHPALQRHLLALLRDMDTDCLIATHSSELVAEAERSEVVLIDKTKRSGERLTADINTKALDALGSSHNFALADALRQRAAFFVEGDSDLRLLKQLGKRLKPKALVGTKVPPRIALGGHRPEKAADIAMVMKILIGQDVRVGVMLDRDYRPAEEVQRLEDVLQGEFRFAHVLIRKEIENYFLSPRVLTKVIDAGSKDQDLDSMALVKSVAENMEAETQSQLVSRYVSFCEEMRSSKDKSTLTREGIDRFREQWRSLEGKLAVVSGKRFLSSLNGVLQDKGVKPLTTAQLAAAMGEGDVPQEITALIREIEALTDQ